jgi:hypothetical protein
VVVLAYHTHLPGELAKTWPHYQETLAREEQELQQRGAGGGRYAKYKLAALRLIFATSATVVLTLKWLGTFQFAYQRVIIRFIQPLMFTGMTILCLFAVSSIRAFLAVIVIGTVLVGGLIWQQRVIALRETADVRVVVISDDSDADVVQEMAKYQLGGRENEQGLTAVAASSHGSRDEADADSLFSVESFSSSSASTEIENISIELHKPATPTPRTIREAQPASSLSDYVLSDVSSLSSASQRGETDGRAPEKLAVVKPISKSASSASLSLSDGWLGSEVSAQPSIALEDEDALVPAPELSSSTGRTVDKDNNNQDQFAVPEQVALYEEGSEEDYFACLLAEMESTAEIEHESAL